MLYSCSKQDSKYKCPKCSVKYCSLSCYKVHNKSCTEQFSKANIEEELKNDRIKDTMKIREMHKVLLKFREDDTDQNESKCDLSLILSAS